jgi:hypothetical protein
LHFLAINLVHKNLDQILRLSSLHVQDSKLNFRFLTRYADCRQFSHLFHSLSCLTLSDFTNKKYLCMMYLLFFFLQFQVDVNGPNTAPIYKFLKSSAGGFLGDLVKWNFEKFLVDKNGKVIERYPPTTSPFQIEVCDYISSFLQHTFFVCIFSLFLDSVAQNEHFLLFHMVIKADRYLIR